MSVSPEQLPYVDEHSTDIEAGAEATWLALLRTMDRTTGGAAGPMLVRVLGCEDSVAAGPRPLAVGSTIPGFHVVASRGAQELALAGRHRFSDYALTFRLEPLGEARTRLAAETRADFPGRRGSVYRALVIGSRGHVLATRRMLDAVRARAERRGGPNGLCDACLHQRLVPNTRGSVFSLCERSRTEAAYPRYPRVPVLSCAGFEPRSP